MSVDSFLSRIYDRDTYNCAHLAAEVWAFETGDDIAPILTGVLAPAVERRAEWSLRRDLAALSRPTSPCIVLMRRPRTAPHVGVYLRGRVLHITERGVQFAPLEIATLGFKVIGFYGQRNSNDKSA